MHSLFFSIHYLYTQIWRGFYRDCQISSLLEGSKEYTHMVKTLLSTLSQRKENLPSTSRIYDLIIQVNCGANLLWQFGQNAMANCQRRSCPVMHLHTVLGLGLTESWYSTQYLWQPGIWHMPHVQKHIQWYHPLEPLRG